MEANEVGKESTIPQDKKSGFIDTYKELKKSFRRLSEHDISKTRKVQCSWMLVYDNNIEVTVLQ